MRRLRFFSCRRILAFTRNPSRLRSSRKYSTFLDSENTEGFRAFQGISPPTSGEFAWLGSSPDALRLWNVSTGTETLIFKDSTEGPQQYLSIPRLVYAPDGTRLAVAGRARGVRVWDAHTGQLIYSLV